MPLQLGSDEENGRGGSPWTCNVKGQVERKFVKF